MPSSCAICSCLVPEEIKHAEAHTKGMTYLLSERRTTDFSPLMVIHPRVFEVYWFLFVKLQPYQCRP
jgi:hypothetical protein